MINDSLKHVRKKSRENVQIVVKMLEERGGWLAHCLQN